MKNYYDDNCESCVHKEVCKMKMDFLKHIMEIRKIVDPELERFGIKILCNYFTNPAPMVKFN